MAKYTIQCAACKGTGQPSEATLSECIFCGGKGYIELEDAGSDGTSSTS